MPVRTLNEIQIAVRLRLEAAVAAGTVLPVKHQFKKFDHHDRPYAELIIAPNDTSPETVDGGDYMHGFILLNVYLRGDNGAEGPAGLAQPFLDLFPRDLEIDNAGNQVLPVTGDNLRIPRTGVIREPVEPSPGDNSRRPNWRYTPVLIPYELRSCSK